MKEAGTTHWDKIPDWWEWKYMLTIYIITAAAPEDEHNLHPFVFLLQIIIWVGNQGESELLVAFS